MTNERSIEMLKDLLLTIDNGGVLYSREGLKELREAVEAAIESLEPIDIHSKDLISRPCQKCEHYDSIYICENCCYNYDTRYEIKGDTEWLNGKN